MMKVPALHFKEIMPQTNGDFSLAESVRKAMPRALGRAKKGKAW